MDIATGLTILGSAAGSAKIIEKILGPTSEYLGAGIKNFTEKGINNISRIFINASKRLGSDIDKPGQVPPMVLRSVLAEGYFCDDLLTSEYFGGVLASSRSEINRDDRGNSMISLISRLSSYQIRGHYLFYTIAK